MSDDLRDFYRFWFGKLDELMLEGQWKEVEKILQSICSDPQKEPVYGVGLLRFCSTGKCFITNWPSLIEITRNRLGEDADQVLRGLEDG